MDSRGADGVPAAPTTGDWILYCGTPDWGGTVTTEMNRNNTLLFSPGGGSVIWKGYEKNEWQHSLVRQCESLAKILLLKLWQKLHIIWRTEYDHVCWHWAPCRFNKHVTKLINPFIKYLYARNFAKLSTISFHYLNAIGNLAIDWYHWVFAVHSRSGTVLYTEKTWSSIESWVTDNQTALLGEPFWLSFFSQCIAFMSTN